MTPQIVGELNHTRSFKSVKPINFSRECILSGTKEACLKKNAKTHR